MPDPEPHLAAADPAADAAAGQSPDVAQDAPVPDLPKTPSGEVDHLQTLLDGAKAYMDIPGVEPSEKHKMAKAVTIITDLLASNQKMSDSVSGANPAVRKAFGTSGG